MTLRANSDCVTPRGKGVLISRFYDQGTSDQLLVYHKTRELKPAEQSKGRLITAPGGLTGLWVYPAEEVREA